ncbi:MULTISPECIES: dihydroorotase [Calditerrivibrio]|jgi:dihydroorotase|uniref:Dihydroorotase n=1 Tax=Calditerrivibrio nitroreducens TaxID=477976 RepID=A0A2J6WMD7_9BACT|nr:MAG: dihydroorotase [Calditerrivibrio nitroreducens]
MSLLLKNCEIINFDKTIKADILIVDDRIKSIGSISEKADRTIDCTGKIVVPGLIDMHVHFRDPGFEYKEDIESGSRAAVAGGVTTSLPMANTKPVNDNAYITTYMIDKAKKVGLIDLYPVGAITKGLEGLELAEIGEMKAAGAIAFSDDGKPVMNSEVMRRAAEYINGVGGIVLSHSEDINLAAKGAINDGKISTITGLKGIPAEAEEIIIARDILISKLTGAHFHFCHVSTKGSLELIRFAKEKGYRVTCEVAPHHFSLTEDELLSYDTNYKMNPPLRTKEDVDAIKKAFKDGLIDCIATDHAPHHRDEKFVEFDLAAFGIIGLQTLIPLTLKLVEEEVITLNDFVKYTSYNPAKILGLADKGLVAEGKIADLAIIDKDKEYIFDENLNRSKSSNSPFIGKKLKGINCITIKSGKIVYEL